MTMPHVEMDEDQVVSLAVEPSPRGWRLGVIRELLGDLDTATVAGQHFTMQKIVGLLRIEVDAVETGLGELQRRVFRRALEDLGHEQERLLPDADAFVMRSQMIADTLALI